MPDQLPPTVTIVERYGALKAGEVPAARTVLVTGLAPDVAGELTAVVLGLPPSWSTPGSDTPRMPRLAG